MGEEVNEVAVAIGKAAPDFELNGIDGKPVRLSQYKGRKNVVLVLSRGFL